MVRAKPTGATLLEQAKRSVEVACRDLATFQTRAQGAETQQRDGFVREQERRVLAMKKKSLWKRALDRLRKRGSGTTEDRDLLLRRGEDIIEDLLRINQNMLALAQSRRRDYHALSAQLQRATENLSLSQRTLMHTRNKCAKGSNAATPVAVVATITASSSSSSAINSSNPLAVLAARKAVHAYPADSHTCYLHANLAGCRRAFPNLLYTKVLPAAAAAAAVAAAER